MKKTESIERYIWRGILEINNSGNKMRMQSNQKQTSPPLSVLSILLSDSKVVLPHRACSKFASKPTCLELML